MWNLEIPFYSPLLTMRPESRQSTEPSHTSLSYRRSFHRTVDSRAVPGSAVLRGLFFHRSILGAVKHFDYVYYELVDETMCCYQELRLYMNPPQRLNRDEFLPL